MKAPSELLLTIPASFMSLTAGGGEATSPNYEPGLESPSRLARRADSPAYRGRDLGWRLEGDWHVEKCAEQPNRMVHLHRHPQHGRNSAEHRRRLVSEEQPQALSRRGRHFCANGGCAARLLLPTKVRTVSVAWLASAWAWRHADVRELCQDGTGTSRCAGQPPACAWTGAL